MLTFETKIKLDKETIDSPNLAEKLSDRELTRLGNWVWDGYNKDKQSRGRWERRTQAAMDLAMQVQKDKNFPWAGCSNVAFPLITIATLQFHSRAYPAIVTDPDLVKYRVVGDDPTGELKARALRIGQHMSYQLLDEDQAWEEQHDRLLINVPIVGCAFKKTYYSGEAGHNVSELVLAQDLVLDYYAKSVESASRKTHVIPLTRNDIYSGIHSGIYCDVSRESWYTQVAVPETGPTTARQNTRDGQDTPASDEDTPFTTLEQHCLLDLDGDGYREPYIVTIEASSKCVLRIVTRFDSDKAIERNSYGRIVRINPTEYFTKYGFIPSPDGGIYDIGFGVLLGPLNESTNSLLNQLIDAGTMSNSAGGFLGRGAKIRGGVYTFAPLEWKRVDSTGDDLRKSIFPLPTREPSAVLFNLLSLLINYTNRVAGTSDTLVGESTGQNTPAQTTQTMMEQGLKLFNAIFKRVWRSMKEEYKKLYLLNRTYLPNTTAFGPNGEKILREDYLGDSNQITPVANPDVTSNQQQIQLAMTIKQQAMATPGYKIDEVERNLLRALHVDGIDVLYPGPDKIPQGIPEKIQLAQLKLQGQQMVLEAEMQQFAMEMMEERRLNTAKILELEAKSAKLLAEAGGVDRGQEIAAFQTAIGALKAHDDALRGRVELMLKTMEKRNESTEPPTDGTGVPGLAGTPSYTGTTLPAIAGNSNA